MGSPCHVGRVGDSMACVTIVRPDVLERRVPSSGRFDLESNKNLPMSVNVACRMNSLPIGSLSRLVSVDKLRSAAYSTHGVLANVGRCNKARLTTGGCG